jgi:uncharacterized protein (TIGR02300 family)
MMSKQLSRGTKRVCQTETCALPFYDLNRTDIYCPNCGTVFDATVERYPRRAQTGAAPWKNRGQTSSAAIAFAAEAKTTPPQLDEGEDAASSTDDVIDADADTLPLDEDIDDEIADVVVPPGDDQVDR